MKLQPKVAVVTFEPGHEYEGLEVRLRVDVPMEIFFDMAAVEAGRNEIGQSRDILTQFADDVLLGWNLEDDSGPLEPTAANFLRQSFQFGMTLLNKWMEVTTQPSAPLGDASRNGALSLVGQGPTEA